MSSGSGSSEGRRKTVSWADEKGGAEKEGDEEEFRRRAPVKGDLRRARRSRFLNLLLLL